MSRQLSSGAQTATPTPEISQVNAGAGFSYELSEIQNHQHLDNQVLVPNPPAAQPTTIVVAADEHSASEDASNAITGSTSAHAGIPPQPYNPSQFSIPLRTTIPPGATIPLRATSAPQDTTRLPSPRPDPFYTVERSAARYNAFKQAGALRRRWMEDPNEPGCTISPVTLDFEQFRTQDHGDFSISSSTANVMILYAELSLPTDVAYESVQFTTDRMQWIGLCASGIVILDVLERERDPNIPHISEVGMANYEQSFALGGEPLTRIYITKMANDHTLDFLDNKLHSDETGLIWPRSDKQTFTYESHPDMFDTTLGTPLGNVAAAMIIGGYPRGTRRIKSFTVWPYGDVIPARMRNPTYAHLLFETEAIVVLLTRLPKLPDRQ
ncbi:hypothetical protein N7532_002720 [Penicillium argentinense]|uniref:Uncharacterized protein n=1 Tax=Penicillium argentinense TaxID=1131581 RepID=A0A9W9G1V2_9EURO|nr:uncharacterized protein N7532_002720 [Penicillium argentinense]KAJ5110075.1 hypothetical protein N7532_002720 [Penicillium argentinense]